jgi:hypothetical protein
MALAGAKSRDSFKACRKCPWPAYDPEVDRTDILAAEQIVHIGIGGAGGAVDAAFVRSMPLARRVPMAAAKWKWWALRSA